MFVNHDIKFPVDIKNNEDKFVAFQLEYYAKKITVLDECLYHYDQTRESAFHNNMTIKDVEDQFEVARRLIKIIEKDTFLDRKDELINTIKLNSKMILITSPNLRNVEYYKTIFPETNKKIFSSFLSLKSKIICCLCINHFSKVSFLIQDTKHYIKKQIIKIKENI